MVHFLEHQPWLRKKILIVLGVVIILVTVLEIWAVNRLSTYGEKLSSLEEAKAKIKLENQVLENEISVHSSLAEVKDQAQILGFEKIEQVEYVQVSDLASN